MEEDCSILSTKWTWAEGVVVVQPVAFLMKAQLGLMCIGVPQCVWQQCQVWVIKPIPEYGFNDLYVCVVFGGIVICVGTLEWDIQAVLSSHLRINRV